jgi:hypothetical protein
MPKWTNTSRVGNVTEQEAIKVWLALCRKRGLVPTTYECAAFRDGWRLAATPERMRGMVKVEYLHVAAQFDEVLEGAPWTS